MFGFKNLKLLTNNNNEITEDSDVAMYKCEVCPKAFKRLDILKRHRATVHAASKQKPPSSPKTSAAKPPETVVSKPPSIVSEEIANSHAIGAPTASVGNTFTEGNSSPHSNSDAYSWISGFTPFEPDTALVSSVFERNDMEWLFNCLDETEEQPLAGASGRSQTPGGQTPAPRDRASAFTTLPEFLNTLSESNLQTFNNAPFLQQMLQSGKRRRSSNNVEVDIWSTIQKSIKQVLFGQYDEPLMSAPKLTLSAAYSSKFRNSPFFEAFNLKRMFDLYFEIFHDQFPILHKPTFLKEPHKQSALLLVSIITLGAYHDSEDNYAVAVELHERLPYLVLSNQDFIPPKLWAIQTLALIQAFEKMASTKHQHDVSATFHSAVITLLRRDGSCANMHEVKHAARGKDHPCPEGEWKLWIEKESIKRCVFLLFMMDAQHSFLFGHSSFMSATEIRLGLPCDENLWNCTNFLDWIKLLTSNKVPSGEVPFLTCLIDTLGLKLLPLRISPFGKLCILHGLLSVIWHVQQRDPGSLGVNNPIPSTQGRKDILQRAIKVWSLSIMAQESSLAAEVSKVMHRVAYITLYFPETSILDILTFCGSSLVGRPLRTSDFAKAKMSVEAWVQSPDSLHGLTHSLLLIHEIVFSANSNVQDLRRYTAKSDKLALRPWSLYMSTLIVWVYNFFRAKSEGVKLALFNVEDYSLSEIFLRAEEFLLGSLRPDLKSSQHSGRDYLNAVYLVVAVRSCLKDCRWEMMRDAYDCLGKLAGIKT